MELLISGVTVGNTLRMGTFHTVRNTLTRVSPVGIAPPAMGVFIVSSVASNLQLPFVGEYTPKTGNAASFGFADSTQYIMANGSSQLKWGKNPHFQNRLIISMTNGIAPPTFLNGSRTSAPDADVNFTGAEYIAPSVQWNNFNFGGVDTLSFRRGIDSLKFGNHAIENTARSIIPPLGINQYSFGARPWVHRADATGIQNFNFKDTYNTPSAQASSFYFGEGTRATAPATVGDSLRMGKTPIIRNLAQSFAPKGIAPIPISNGHRTMDTAGMVDYYFYQSYTPPSGNNAPFNFWGQRIVYVAPIAPPPISNLHWVSYWVRTVGVPSIGDTSVIGTLNIYTPQIYSHSTNYKIGIGDENTLNVVRGTGGQNLGYVSHMFLD